MHKILPAFFLLLGLPLAAQIELSLSPPSFNDTFLLNLSLDHSEGKAVAILSNDSDETVLLRWEVLTENAGCPNSWDFLFCDENFCGSSTTTSNINPGSKPNLPLEIDPGKLSTFDLTVRPRGAAGCCQPKVTVSTIDDFDDILLTAEYHICVEGITATGEADRDNLQVFPNPTSGRFFLSENEVVRAVQVWDVLGRRVRNFTADRFDLSGLPAGLYFVSLLGKEGALLKTVWLRKH